MHGELDWITLKAMDKDKTKRYQMAHTFAEDIQRYLNQEPVLAGPPSATYKLKKSVNRNKALFGSARGVSPYWTSAWRSLIIVLYDNYRRNCRQTADLKDVVRLRLGILATNEFERAQVYSIRVFA